MATYKQALRKIYRRAARAHRDAKYKLTLLPVIDRKLLTAYEQMIVAHKPFLPSLSDADSRILSLLHRDGVVATSLGELELYESEQIIHAGRALTAIYSDMAARGAQAFFDPYLVQATPAEKFQYPELFRWGLNLRLLEIAESYFCLPVAYNGVNLFYTLADGIERGSRVWHRDGEDRRTLKVVVYLGDVDITGGPFEVLHRKIPGTSSMKSLTFTSKKLQRQVGGSLNEGDVTSFVGRLGTVIIVDTARLYHRGRPAITKDRSALFYSYFSRRPRNPFYCEPNQYLPSQMVALTSDLTSRQQECALWRDTLPTLSWLRGTAAYRAP